MINDRSRLSECETAHFNKIPLLLAGEIFFLFLSRSGSVHSTKIQPVKGRPQQNSTNVSLHTSLVDGAQFSQRSYERTGAWMQVKLLSDYVPQPLENKGKC